MDDKIKTLKGNFQKCIDDLVAIFEEKHDLVFEYAIDNDVFFFNRDNYQFSLTDICTDIFDNLPKGEICKWHEYVTNWSFIGSNHYINLKSWVKGCPRRTDAQYKEAYDRYIQLQKHKQEFEKYLENIKHSL